MNAHDEADMLIKTITVWRFLQHVDEEIEGGNEEARAVANRFFDGYASLHGMSIADIADLGLLPFAQLKTTMAILQVTLCYGWSFFRPIGGERTRRITVEEWREAGIQEPLVDCYDLRCTGPENPDICQLLRILRSAVAHCFDDSNGHHITFAEAEVVSFRTSRHGESSVIFRTQEGFVKFVRDYVHAVESIATNRL